MKEFNRGFRPANTRAARHSEPAPQLDAGFTFFMWMSLTAPWVLCLWLLLRYYF